MKRHESFNQRVAKGNVDLIFIGDSITHAWESSGKAVWEKHYAKRNAVNLGISGDRTQHVLWRLDNGNIKNIRPKAAVIMIGTNNSGDGRNTAEEMIDGVTAVVDKLRAKLPKMEILLLDIFPRGQRINAQRGKILQVNQVLSRLDARPQVLWRRAPVGAAAGAAAPRAGAQRQGVPVDVVLLQLAAVRRPARVLHPPRRAPRI